jgi:hypothetical protein
LINWTFSKCQSNLVTYFKVIISHSKPLPTNPCAKCGNQHFEEYTMIHNICYMYKKTWHIYMKKDCPRRNRTRMSKTNRARKKKGVYPRRKKGQTKQWLNCGYMRQSHLFVLLDTRANHSFISSKYVQRPRLVSFVHSSMVHSNHYNWW